MIIKKARNFSWGDLQDLAVEDILEIREVNQGLNRKELEESKKDLQRTVNCAVKDTDFLAGRKYDVSVLKNGEIYVSIRRAV